MNVSLSYLTVVTIQSTVCEVIQCKNAEIAQQQQIVQRREKQIQQMGGLIQHMCAEIQQKDVDMQQKDNDVWQKYEANQILQFQVQRLQVS